MRRVVLVPLIAAITFCMVAGVFLFKVEPTPAAALPAGFEDKLVTSAEKPTAMAFTPDGRMLISTKDGQLRVRREGSSVTTKALDISARICANSERGLLGIAVDPDFKSNNYVYLYYTAKVGPGCDGSRNERNRVSRFVMNDNTVAASSEKILIGAIPSTGGNHNAGDLHFGKDGLLYASVGDGGTDYKGDSGSGGSNDAARDRNVLLGKILRVTRNGGIPADNPFVGPDSARCYDPAPGGNKSGRVPAGKTCRETFATGLRNPFRMAFDPDAAETRFFINDVGQNAWEEVDRGIKGADYGWNLCEGRHDNPDRPGSAGCVTGEYVPPVHEYNHERSGCSSITGGAFVPDAASWPSAYDGAYLFGDYVCGRIFKLSPRDGGGYDATGFVGGLGQGGPTAMTFGPSRSGQDLYYATFAGGGQIRRVSYTIGNRAPDVTVKTTNGNYGPQDKAFGFSAEESTDPDGDPLTFEWDFDYTEDGFTQDAAGKTASHTYGAAGKKTVAVRASDGRDGREISTLDVFAGNTAPPAPTIESLAAGATFRVGGQVSLRGSATDADEPGTPPSLRWDVVRHHNNNHTHPYRSGVGESLEITGPEPEDLFATDPSGNFLEVRLTATDSQGLSASVSRRLEPRTTNVTFATRPRSLKFVVNGRDMRAPKTLLSWEGYRLNVAAPGQRRDGRSYAFDSWSTGRAARHTIVTPEPDSRYVATFERRQRR